MCFHRRNIDDFLEFPHSSFWFVHIIGILALFYMGMRFAVRRAPFPIMMYRFVRMLGRR
jgi:hypothetical protein